MDKKTTKCCMVSIVGRPNAGKSSLTNILVGQKFSIVTPKVQTTRTLMSGIFTEGNLQVVLIDTPGIFEPQKNLERAMVKTAYRSLEEGLDLILHLIDSKKGISSEDKQIISVLKEKKIPVIAALNKIDLIKQEALLPLAKDLFEFGIYKEIFMISATKKTGISDLIAYFSDNAPEAPFLYPEDEITSLTSKVLASEITREKLFLCLDKELPYNLTVETEQLESSDTLIKIHQAIMVSKENHKKIILGKNGTLIKQIGISARKELEYIFGKKVHLMLFVKVRENWMDKPDSYRYLGMEQP